MKNTYLILLAFLILPFQYLKAEEVTTTIHFSDDSLTFKRIVAEDGNTYSNISYSGLNNCGSPGSVSVPSKYIYICLPVSAENIILSYETSKPNTYRLQNVPYPAQPPISFNQDKVRFVNCDTIEYKSEMGTPVSNASIREISHVGGKKEVVVCVHPIKYYPTKKTFEFYESIKISVNYTLTSDDNNVGENYLSQANTAQINLPAYEYCVITTRNLKDSFRRLVGWKRQKGLNAGIVCVEDILNDPGIASALAANNEEIQDDAGKIRQYLRYVSSCIQRGWYVLFGGDATILPIRYGTGDIVTGVSCEEDRHIPSDLYFSNLSNNWKAGNNLNDTIYGKKSQITNYGASFCVGRLLCTTENDVQRYTDKMLRYEMIPGQGNYQYLNKGFYQQADDAQNNRLADSIASRFSSVLPNYTVMQEEPDGQANPTSPTGEQVLNEMKMHYGYMSWFGHGCPYSIRVRNVDGQSGDTIYAIKSVTGLIPDIKQESGNGLDKLSNKDFPALAYSVSCTIAPFDIYHGNQRIFNEFPNIAYSFTNGSGYGGPALIGNSRMGWMRSSDRLQLETNNFLKSEEYLSYGEAFAYAKPIFQDDSNGEYKHYSALSANLIGCPELRMWTSIPSAISVTTTDESNQRYINLNGYYSNYIYLCEKEIFNEDEAGSTFRQISYGDDYQMDDSSSLVTITGKNCLPKILPLSIEGKDMMGSHYLFTKDVTCSRDNYGVKTVFVEGSDYLFETSGSFKLTKGVTVERGAKLKIMPSDIKF